MLHSNNWSYPPSNIRDITIHNHTKLSIVMHNYMPSITPTPTPTPAMPPCAARTCSEDPHRCALHFRRLHALHATHGGHRSHYRTRS